MMAGPRSGEDIRYFYSRINPDGTVRWASYHSATADVNRNRPRASHR
jgi:hypothetical protein